MAQDGALDVACTDAAPPPRQIKDCLWQAARSQPSSQGRQAAAELVPCPTGGWDSWQAAAQPEAQGFRSIRGEGL